MKHAPVYAIAALTLATLLCSCGKSPEKETKKWESNVTTAQEAVALHPTFGDVLKAELATAQTAMDSALKETDEKVKAKKMAEANKLLAGGTFGQLRTLERELKDIRKAMIDAPSKAVDQSDRMAVEQALTMAKTAVTKAEAVLQAGAKDASQANIVLKQALRGLSEAESGIKRAVANAKKKAKAQASSTKTTGPASVSTQSGANTPAAVPAAKPWTCSYCGSKHDAKVTKCPGCGGARQ